MAIRDIDARRRKDRERYHQRTATRRQAGRCVRCGKFPPVAGRASCEGCAEKDRQRERARNERLKAEGRPRRDSARRKEADRERYRKAAEDRAARQLCRRCGKAEPAPDRSLCAPCGAKVRSMARARYHRGKDAGLAYGGRCASSRRRSARVRSERRRREWTEAGLCTRCGQREPEENGTTCAPCRTRRQARERETYSSRRQAGLCVRCGTASTFDGAAMCLACSALEAESGRPDRKNAAARRRYRELRSAGRCTTCGAASQGASRCVPCARKSYELSAHFRGIPDWEPEYVVVDLLTMEEHGPFGAEGDAAACIAFLKLPRERFEIVAERHPMSAITGA
ncbi:MAG: hypothetical protein OXN16_12660 [Gammaproteobacteria bacterium]|nr:hypothetical protein [Gammaproteobacteria bacterium]